MGEKKTPNPFVVACDKFIYIEILKKQTEESKGTSGSVDTIGEKEIALISSSINALSDEDGWAFLWDVGGLIQKKQPSFDSRNYGFEKLTPLIKATGKFEIEQRDNSKSRYKLIYVRNVQERKWKVEVKEKVGKKTSEMQSEATISKLERSRKMMRDE